METAVTNEKDEENLKILEQKIRRSISGPNITRDGDRRLKLNRELDEELGGENIVRHYN